MTSARACETSGFTVQRQGDFAVATVAQRVQDCADCGGTGLLRSTVTDNNRTYEVVAPCPRAKLILRASAFSEAHLPAVHAQASFDNFRPSNTEQARALQIAKDFALRYPQPRGYVLSGPVGTGKTHLLCATLKHLALELGKGRGSAFELDTLDELIARRYNAGRVTLFATNYSLKSNEDRAQRGYLGTGDLVESTKESKLLCDRVGDRIYSRLCEMCEFVEFPGNTADQRRAKTVAQGGPGASPRR